MITIVEQPSLFNFGGKLGAYGTKFGRFYICHQLSCNIPAEDVELHLFITYMIIIPKEPILAILGQICGFLGVSVKCGNAECVMRKVKCGMQSAECT